MKYSEKVWKYFNFTKVMHGTAERSDGSKYRRLDINISGKKEITYLINLIIVGVFLFWPLIVSIWHANTSDEILLTNQEKEILAIITNIILPAIIVIIKVFLQIKEYKITEPKPRNIDIYKRELPSKLRPAHVCMLMYDGMIDSTALAATILDLVDKGYLEIITENVNIEEFFSQEKIILRKTKKTTEDLFKYEKFLIEWFIDYYGNGEEIDNFTIQEALKQWAKGKKPCELFEHFQALVAISFPLNVFYDKTVKEQEDDYVNNLFLALLLSFIPIPYIMGIPIAFLLANIFTKKPNYIINKRGVDERDSWLDFKRYLMEFTLIKDKSDEDIILYNNYLVYSVALGVNEILRVKIERFFSDALYNESMPYSARYNYKNDTTISDEFSDDDNDIQKIENDIKEELEKYKKINES